MALPVFIGVCLLMTSLPSLHCEENHFLGGSLSYEFLDTSPGLYTVLIRGIIGWKLGKGPCGASCSSLITVQGHNNNVTRRIMLHDNDPLYFGNWKEKTQIAPIQGHPYRITREDTLTAMVSEIMHSQLLAMNADLGWEQEIIEIKIPIHHQSIFTDISLHGSYWTSLDVVHGGTIDYNMHIVIEKFVRNDTNLPNRSPQALLKPIYTIALNQAIVITIPVFDPDGDYIRCEAADGADSGGIQQLSAVTVHKNCTVSIFPMELLGFSDGRVKPIAISVSDYNTKTIALEGDALPYRLSGRKPLTVVPVQFLIKTVTNIQGPEFVSPTPVNQKFIIYVGGHFTVDLFAKPHQGSTATVSSFYLITIPRRPYTSRWTTFPDNDRMSERVRTTHIYWNATDADIGTFLLRAVVVDSDGVEGEDRDYVVEIKDLPITNKHVIPKRGPYFTLTPLNETVHCVRGSTCVFPIYTGVISISDYIVSLTVEVTTLQSIHIGELRNTYKEGHNLFVNDITVYSSIAVDQILCLKATEKSGASIGKCFDIILHHPDPCEHEPCENGECQATENNFTCKCHLGYTGDICEIRHRPCDSHPCANNQRCLTSPTHPDQFICI